MEDCSNNNEIIRIGANVWIGYQPLYLAQNLGYFSDLPVSIVEMPSATDELRAFRNGLIDCAALTLDETYLLMQDGFDVKVLFIIDISNGGDVLLSKPEIKNIKELKGKKVGVENSAVGAYTLSRALEFGGLKPSDINIISNIAFQEEDFYSGKLDAIVTYEPMRTRLIDSGAKILFDSHQIPNEIFDVFVVRNEFLKNRKNDLKKLEDIWFKTLNQISLNLNNSIELISKRMNFTPAKLIKSLEGIKFPNKEENDKLINGSFLISANKIVDVMLKEKLLNKQIDPANLIINF